jgi:hypothetical protein
MNSSVDAGTERSTILASHPEPSRGPRANLFHYIGLGALCVASLLGSGCIFSPDRGNGGPPPKPIVVYPKRITPKSAVLFLTIAWSARDSAQIDSVYADDYEGTSNDLNDPTAQNLRFVKSDEVRAVGAMALSSNIVTTSMYFGPTETWIEDHYVSDPPEWRYVQIPSFEIYVNAGADGEFRAKHPGAISQTWLLEFTLRPTYPNGPSGEPVWEIVKWVENRANL